MVQYVNYVVKVEPYSQNETNCIDHILAGQKDTTLKIGEKEYKIK